MDKKHPILFKLNYIEGNNHTSMLKKFYELSIAGFYTILYFSDQNFWSKIEIYLIHYYRFVTGEDNHFQIFGRLRLFYGQKLVLQKNCSILFERFLIS